MKKKFLFLGIDILILVLFIIWCATRECCIPLNNQFRLYDIKEQSQKEARQILYEYLLEYSKKEINPNHDIKLSRTYAIFVDLNNDGESEIIGYPNCFYYGGTTKNRIFVLQKNGNKYINIIKYPFYVNLSDLIITKNKSNEYYDMIFVENDPWNDKKNYIVIRNHNDFYYTEEDYNSLREIIENKNYFDEMDKYDLVQNESEKANKILYKYVLEQDLKMSPKEAEDFAHITYDVVRAMFVDLNNDGVDEVLGIVWSGYYISRSDPFLFVLKKEKDGKYVALSGLDDGTDFSVSEGIYISKNINRDYKDIVVIRYEKPVILKYFEHGCLSNHECYKD